MAVFNNILNGASGQTGGVADYQIERSLRFNRNDSAYLSRTPSSAGNRRTWTWSGWVKLSSEDRKVLFAQTTNTASQFFILEHRNNVLDIYDYNGGVYNSNLSTSRVFRDYSAWYHIVFTYDTTNSTADDRQRLYVNGEQITSFGSRTNPSQNFEGFVNTAAVHYLSGYTSTGTLPHDGYMAEVHFIDGQSLAASDFGEYDDNNVWQPKAYSGTYGTNGWYLNFSDATNTTTIAEDSSGNGNHWTATNISVAAGAGNDSLLDSPTNGTQTDTGAGGEVSGNYCTLNAAKPSTGVLTISNGALVATQASGAADYPVTGTIFVNSGKWYWEVDINNPFCYAGIATPEGANISSSYLGQYSGQALYNVSSISSCFIDGVVYNYTTATTATGAQTIGVALDFDNNQVTFYKNGTSMGVFGSNFIVGRSWGPAAKSNGTVTLTHSFNFGQRPFSYSAPSGFKALCTANLDTPTIEDGSTAMDVALWTGNATNRTISGLGHEPDLIWIKDRTSFYNHILQDSVRGFTTLSKLSSNGNWAEGNTAELADWAGYVNGTTSDGFTLTKNGTGAVDWAHVNKSSDAYVGWTWDAGSSTVSNTDGSTTANVRANASTGCSILSYTGTSANATIGHGLNAAPEFIIIKNRDRAINWIVYHASLGATKYLELDTSDQAGTLLSYFNNTDPTSSVVSVGAAVATNYTGQDIIAYCWAPVEGYSSFGSYSGNGSTDGPFVYTGFRPRWIMFKGISGGGSVYNWFVVDTERDPDNLATTYLIPNLTNVESSTLSLDILSNGFKWRQSSIGVNGSGSDYIYAAFAEHPFKTARAR